MKIYPLKVALRFLWKNRTRTFATVQGFFALFASQTDIFTIAQIKWFLFTNAILTYLLGQVNAWLESRATITMPDPSPETLR